MNAQQKELVAKAFINTCILCDVDDPTEKQIDEFLDRVDGMDYQKVCLALDTCIRWRTPPMPTREEYINHLQSIRLE